VLTSSITYSSDGLKVRAYLMAPREELFPKGTKLPCVIYNRGGHDTFNEPTDVDALLNLAPYANMGYIVVASMLRGSSGSDGHDEFGGKDVDDVLNLIPLLESIPRADAKRIGMVGKGRGGMQTMLALKRTERISAAIVNSGLFDAFDWVKTRP